MKTNLNPQRSAARKLSFKKVMASLAIASIATFSSLQSNAQPFNSSCLSTQIDISTGLDNTGAVLPYPSGTTTDDPYWMITMLPTNSIVLTPSFCAKLVDANEVSSGSFGSRSVTGAAYISFASIPTVANFGAGCGMFATYDHTAPGGPISGANPIRFTRRFYIEGASPVTVTINMNGYGDDIVFMAVDATPGTPIYNNGSGHANNIYYQATTSTTVTPMSATKVITLSPGAHTIDMDLYDISLIREGLSIHGTISAPVQALALNSCYGENNCDVVVNPECDDECYWTVDGNNIHNGRNKLGTLSDDNINIIANGANRGVITSGPAGIGNSFLGWNTMAPTSIFHVDCMGNHDDGSGMSDIRFENLEHGFGNILVIDDQGHVFRTDYYIEDIISGGGDGAAKMNDVNQKYDDLKVKYDQLQKDFSSLSARLDALQNCCSNNGNYSDVNTTNSNNVLYQNTPNPFSAETTIEYDIQDMKSNAFIAIYDLSGRELNRYMIDAKGRGSVTVQSDKMESGMYVYALVVDGQEVATKKMVFTKH